MQSGPAWLSQLSAWWVSLGILPTFSRRARPGDNGAHEQWHRDSKQHHPPPAATPTAQQRRLQAWLRVYNLERPHEALGMVTPDLVYYRSRRKISGPQPSRYPRDWTHDGYVPMEKLNGTDAADSSARPSSVRRSVSNRGEKIGGEFTSTPGLLVKSMRVIWDPCARPFITAAKPKV